MSIQSSINHALESDRNRSITLKGESGSVVLPADVTLNLIECTISSMSLGERTTVNVTKGSISGAISTVLDGQCQLMLHKVGDIAGSLTLNNCICELSNCILNGVELNISNGSKLSAVGCEFNCSVSAIGSRISLVNSPVSPVTESSDCLTLDNSSAFVSDSQLSSVEGRSILAKNGSNVEYRSSEQSEQVELRGVELNNSSSGTITNVNFKPVGIYSAIKLANGSSLSVSNSKLSSANSANLATAILVEGSSALDFTNPSADLVSNNLLVSSEGNSKVFLSNTREISGGAGVVNCSGGSSVQIIGFNSIVGSSTTSGLNVSHAEDQIFCTGGSSSSLAVPVGAIEGEIVLNGIQTISGACTVTTGSLKILNCTSTSECVVNEVGTLIAFKSSLASLTQSNGIVRLEDCTVPSVTLSGGSARFYDSNITYSISDETDPDGLEFALNELPLPSKSVLETYLRINEEGNLYQFVKGQLVPVPTSSQGHSFLRVKGTPLALGSHVDTDAPTDYELVEGILIPIPSGTGTYLTLVTRTVSGVTASQVSLSGQGGKILVVNSAGTGLAFIDSDNYALANHNHGAAYSASGHTHTP